MAICAACFGSQLVPTCSVSVPISSFQKCSTHLLRISSLLVSRVPFLYLQAFVRDRYRGVFDIFDQKLHSTYVISTWRCLEQRVYFFVIILNYNNLEQIAKGFSSYIPSLLKLEYENYYISDSIAKFLLPKLTYRYLLLCSKTILS